MRHVFTTHRDALDWSFDGINVDPMIQIKHIDTKNQLADRWTLLTTPTSSHLTEELRHAETNPTCETHESNCTSH